MKVFVVLSTLFVAALAANDYCYKDTVQACTESKQSAFSEEHCSAQYGAIKNSLSDLQGYANQHIVKSFEYLLMATHFGNYEKNRVGFEKLFRGLSDKAWEDAFDLIKYIGKRGGAMNFGMPQGSALGQSSAVYELYEMESLGKALDMEKHLATEAYNIHRKAIRSNNEHHDPEISAYIEEHFVHGHASIIRKLSGYITDLRGFFSDKTTSSLALYLFDEYLSKQ